MVVLTVYVYLSILFPKLVIIFIISLLNNYLIDYTHHLYVWNSNKVYSKVQQYTFMMTLKDF